MQQNPQTNYKKLFEQAKQLTKKQQQQIFSLQQQIRERCQSYLIQQSNKGGSNRVVKSYIRNVQKIADTGVKSMILGSNNNLQNTFMKEFIQETSSTRQRPLNFNENVLNQKIVGSYGVSSIGKDDIIQVKQGAEGGTHQTIIINTNFDSQSQAIISLKEKIVKTQAQKNVYFKEVQKLKQDSLKKDDQISSLKGQIQNKEKYSVKVNKDVEELQKYKKAYAIMESEISSIMNHNQLYSSQQRQNVNDRDPVSKMKNYIEKIRETVLRNQKFVSELSEGSLLAYSQTAYDPQDPQQRNREMDLFPATPEQNGDQVINRAMNHVVTHKQQSPTIPKRYFIKNAQSINLNLPRQRQQMQIQKVRNSSPRAPINQSDIFTNSMRQIGNSNKKGEQLAVQYVKSDSGFSSAEKQKQTKRQVQQANKKSYQAKKEAQEAKKQIQRAKRQLQQTKKEIQALTETIEKYEFQIKLLKKQAQSKLKLQVQVDKLEGEVQRLKYQLNDKEAQLKEFAIKKNDQDSVGSASIMKNSIQYTKEDENIAEELRLLRVAQEKLKTKNQNLQNELYNLNSQLKELRAMNQKQKAIQTHNIRLQKQNQYLRNQIRQLQKNCDQLQQISTQLENIKEAYQNLKQQKQMQKSKRSPQKNFEVKSLSPQRPGQIYQQRYEDILLERQNLLEENKILRQKLQFEITNREQAPHDPDLSPYYIQQDIDSSGQTAEYVKRRFKRKKVVRRNLSAMTFKATSNGKQETIQHLKNKLEKLKEAHGKSTQQNTQIKKFANKISRLQKRLQLSDKISEVSHQSSDFGKVGANGNQNERQGDRNSGVTDEFTFSSSNNDLQDQIHIFELTTETPNKIVSSSKIFESLNRKKQKQQEFAQNQRQNRFNFIKKGKTESSGIL